MRKLIYTSLLIYFASQFVMAQPSIRVIGKPVKISKEDQIFMRPSWSPAGDKIAFTGPNYKGIWLYDLRTETIKNLTSKDGAGYKFRWSPDGEYILFRARYTDNYRAVMDIEAVEVKSNKVIFLTSQQKRLGLPQWGEDNSRIFVTQLEKLTEIPTGIQNTKSLAKSKQLNRERLIFTRYGKLQTAPLTKPDSLTAYLKDTEIINPAISPDGYYVVYEEYGGDLFVFNFNTGRKVSLGKGHRPCWSPDGRWISFMVTEDDGHQYLSSDVYITSVDGKQQFNITDTGQFLEMNPNWSSDLSLIVYDEFSTGSVFIQRIRVE